MPRPPSAPPLLGIEDLAGRRGDRLMFFALSAAIEPGGVLRLSGPNGCGKTTALRIVCGLLPADSGRVRWRGRVVSDRRSFPEWRHEVAYVGHQDAVKDSLTPLENLRFASALRRGAAAARPEEALERLGLREERDTLARELSAGQRRRTSLARLLLHDTPLWVLDEPAAALDREGARIVESMGTEHTARGGAILFTSHQALRLSRSGGREIRLAG